MITKYIIKTFINTSNNENKKRIKYGLVSSLVGIFVNIILFISKIILGISTGSISLVADSINNLTDVGSSLVSFIGFKLSSKPADIEHPFGHGRTEYLSSLIISIIILLLGIELFKNSIEKIINPVDIKFSWTVLIILSISILVKIWLSRFYNKISHIANSKTLKAVSIDSMSDVWATSCVILSFVINKITSYKIDGFIGLLVAVFIIYNGIKIAKETIDVLLGEKTDPELLKQLKEYVMHYEGILDVHDIVIHDYGPSNKMGSLHVEISSNLSVLVAHELIDKIERNIKNEFNIALVIHLDPIINNCKLIDDIRKKVISILNTFKEVRSIHDFRIIEENLNNTMLFDIVIDENISLDNMNTLKKSINNSLHNNFDSYKFLITFEKENHYYH